MTTAALLSALLALAVVDSINPSALLVTGYILLKAPQHRKVAAVVAYVAGIFCAYLGIGLAAVLGLEVLLSVSEEAELFSAALQGILGLAMLVWAALPKKQTSKRKRFTPRSFTNKALFGLGMAVTIVELVSAFPYFGAIGLLHQASLTPLAVVATLIAYNVIFITPPLVLLAVYRVRQKRIEGWLQQRQKAKEEKQGDALQWVIGVIGVMLILNALAGLGLLD